MKAQMQTLSEFDNISLITKILDNRYFLFIYNRDKFRMSEEEFLKPK